MGRFIRCRSNKYVFWNLLTIKLSAWVYMYRATIMMLIIGMHTSEQPPLDNNISIWVSCPVCRVKMYFKLGLHGCKYILQATFVFSILFWKASHIHNRAVHKVTRNYDRYIILQHVCELLSEPARQLDGVCTLLKLKEWREIQASVVTQVLCAVYCATAWRGLQ